MMLNLEITLGNILTIISIVSGGFVFLFSLRGQIDLIRQALSGVDRRLTSVESSISLLSQTTVQLAKQEARLDSHAQRLNTLEREMLGIKKDDE